MPRIAGICMLLFLSGWAACELSLGEANTCSSVWRRTREGWQRQEHVVRLCQTPVSPTLHPALLVAAQLGISAGLLVAGRGRAIPS